jgi:hypothetical protein
MTYTYTYQLEDIIVAKSPTLKGTFKESIVIEYRVSDYKFQKSIGVSISNTGPEVSEYRISNTEKSIGCPALANCDIQTCVSSLEYSVFCEFEAIFGTILEHSVL